MSYQQQVSKKNTNPDTSIHKSLHKRPSNIKSVNNSNAPLTQQEIENQQYQQDRFEATKLEIQMKYGTITPERQERLTFLQTKKADFWQRYQEKAERNRHNLANISVSRSQVSSQQPIQAKLAIGAVGDKYEQEADRVAAKVVNQINAPVSGQPTQNVQREEMPFKDELMMKPEIRYIEPTYIQRTISGSSKDTKPANILKKVKEKVDGRVEKAEFDRVFNALNGDTKNNYTVDQAVESIIDQLGKPRKTTASDIAKAENTAGKEKSEKIKEYTELLGHMAGEDGDQVTGGHLLTAMMDTWGDSLDAKLKNRNDTQKWNMEWRLKKSQNYKTSTMFPASWTLDNLQEALQNSTEVSGKLTLNYNGISIPIKKAGGTFYPE